jgi:hypothetical protein
MTLTIISPEAGRSDDAGTWRKVVDFSDKIMLKINGIEAPRDSA